MARYAKTEHYTNEENAFWERFCACEGRGFSTMKGLQFSFEVRGNEVFFDRKAKSVTRATIIRGYRKALELSANGGRIRSLKQLGVFGASYLLPVLGWMGVLCC